MSVREPPLANSRAAYYADSIAGFIAASEENILGTLTASSSFAVDVSQRDAWLAQICILRETIFDLDGWLLFEFNVPRVGSRIDVVLIVGPVVFVIEFKVGEAFFSRGAINQVWDYGVSFSVSWTLF